MKGFEESSQDRGYVQKSVLVLSKVPLFNYILVKLNITTHVYFNQKNFQETLILEEFYNNANTHSVDKLTYTDFITTNNYLEKFCKFLGSNLLTLLKAIMLEKKIVVFSEKSSTVSQFIISILSLFPGCVLFKFDQNEVVKAYSTSINKLGFPLKLFNKKTQLLPSASIRDLKKLEKLNGYFIGTTNLFFMQNTTLKADLKIYLKNESIINDHYINNEKDTFIICDK